jgi:uncharacterized membrane protein
MNGFSKHSDAHQRAFVALVVAGLVLVLTWGRVSREVQLVLVWDGFAVTSILLAWLRILTSNPLTVVRAAKLQDASRVTIFLFVLAAAVASLFAVASLLAKAKEFHGSAFRTHILLAVATVGCSWVLLHTIFTLHYAHSYYRRNDLDPMSQTGSGLQFPGEEQPDFLDFAYFSFVVGMTFQVSDVQISSKQIRRFVLVHGFLSFVFSTVILALAINLASGLLTPGS